MKRPTLTLEESSARSLIALGGSWRAHYLPEIAAELSRLTLSRGKPVVVNGEDLDAIDTAAATLLLTKLRESGNTVEFVSASDDAIRILALVKERWPASGALRERRLGILGRIGEGTTDVVRGTRELFTFIGASASELGRLFLNPRQMRLRELFVQLEHVGLDAVPVVCMMMFLIGIVIAYLFATQIEKYGANIFIVDGVSIAICRELSPVIVAIILAGRSGSAFTAHLGSMKLNEEIDAMRVMSLSPMQVLVLPRFLALVFALPALVFLGDVVGILAGMVVADVRLGITADSFIMRLHDVLKVRHFLVGLVKAPVFAAFIAVIGCKMGLTVENNARAVGLATTSTVVQSIVAVILINAAFAIAFVQLGI
jgi:phospholipid/cholesterol/gamma-HCH transport system permease protein